VREAQRHDQLAGVHRLHEQLKARDKPGPVRPADPCLGQRDPVVKVQVHRERVLVRATPSQSRDNSLGRRRVNTEPLPECPDDDVGHAVRGRRIHVFRRARCTVAHLAGAWHALVRFPSGASHVISRPADTGIGTFSAVRHGTPTPGICGSLTMGVSGVASRGRMKITVCRARVIATRRTRRCCVMRLASIHGQGAWPGAALRR
jgi:hypothetical protein